MATNNTEDLTDAQNGLREIAENIHKAFEAGEVPSIDVPTRSSSNIVFDEDEQVWVQGDSTTARSVNSVRGAQKLFRMLYTVEFLNRQLEEGRSSTLRELYYLSESWDNEEAQFPSQNESNNIIEDLEVTSGVRREEFNMRPEESGATVMGPLKIREQTRRGEREIHCQKDVGEGGYQIPNDPDTIEFLNTQAEFVLAVETGGMRDRLVENGFDADYDALVTHLKGQPARATRRLIKRFHDELNLPILVFTDGDPWSYRIYGSVAFGAAKTAHLSTYLATPEAEYIGITPQDILDYNLPSDPLSDSDINALENELDNPRFQDEFWQKQIELQLEIEKKSEQQSLASQGLDFVTDTYLPDKLSERGLV